ncbi:MAG TPA: glycoside hydrolase family 15 protein, partial [Gemmatimonadaceae bacterium]|nr:glycoside hydrolase family 15 protein [Gemmatimonadaceae bacterium]
VCDEWCLPDHGIWEVRGAPRHYVHSKVMAWVALDRAVRMAAQFGLEGDVARWRYSRAKVKAAVLEQGYDATMGAFVQSFGSTALDAANLLIPIVEFLPFDDPRVQGTISATLRHLTVDGIVYRYLNDDGLPGDEGAFGLTTFWLVEALALSGRTAEARELFAAMAARANHLGLYSEEFDPRTGEMLGNFPQAFTHIGFVNAALYLAREEGKPTPEPAPLGSREHRAEGRRKERRGSAGPGADAPG